MKSVHHTHGMARAVANIKMRGKLVQALTCGCCDAVNWLRQRKTRKVERDQKKLQSD